MKLLDSRRLTGLNVIWDQPCAIVDVEFTDNNKRDENSEVFYSHWSERINAMLKAIGWSNEQTAIHYVAGGMSLVVSAPIDCLYAAVEMAEWAFEQTFYNLENDPLKESPGNFDEAVQRIRALIAEEKNPAILDIAQQAIDHEVAFLWDDDDISVGYGKGSISWPVDKLPHNIEWSKVHNIPVVLVTGTNGKTTTVRLSSHILKASGQSVGLTSTDWVGVNNEIIERGDFSGPGGARTVLRQTNVDVAILETARGGLLRRGLGVQRADVALITNVSEDHLGDFGSRNLKELMDLKWIVMQALDEESIAILNADDAMLVDKSSELTKPTIHWFSLDPDNLTLQKQIKNASAVVTVVDDNIVRFDGKKWHSLCAVETIPITLNGIAKHNIANALAAVSLCSALGVADAAIVSGLQSMTANENPGRCNLFSVNGCEVLLDFAHNPEGMAGIFDIASKHPAKRRILCFGQAGDRTDRLIQELAQRAWSIGLEHVIISELSDYLRGREPGEVYDLLRSELLKSGAREDQISHNQLESESLAEALTMAQEGDLIIMLALGEAKALLKTLNELGESVL